VALCGGFHPSLHHREINDRARLSKFWENVVRIIILSGGQGRAFINLKIKPCKNIAASFSCVARVRNSLLVLWCRWISCVPPRAQMIKSTQKRVCRLERPGRRREVINNSELQAKLLHCLLLPPRGFSLSSLGVKNLGEPCCAQRAACVDAASAREQQKPQSRCDSKNIAARVRSTLSNVLLALAYGLAFSLWAERIIPKIRLSLRGWAGRAWELCCVKNWPNAGNQKQKRVTCVQHSAHFSEINEGLILSGEHCFSLHLDAGVGFHSGKRPPLCTRAAAGLSRTHKTTALERERDAL